MEYQFQTKATTKYGSLCQSLARSLEAQPSHVYFLDHRAFLVVLDTLLASTLTILSTVDDTCSVDASSVDGVRSIVDMSSVGVVCVVDVSSISDAHADIAGGTGSVDMRSADGFIG